MILGSDKANKYTVGMHKPVSGISKTNETRALLLETKVRLHQYNSGDKNLVIHKIN